MLICHVDGVVYSAPAIPEAVPSKDPVSITPRTRLRTVRVIQPSRALLPPYSSITSSELQDSISEKVIIHTKASKTSKINGYKFPQILVVLLFLFKLTCYWVCEG